MFGLTDPVLLDIQLKRLAEHKYSSSGSTLLDPVMQRVWNWTVTKVPMWVAPNLLTITGLTVNIVTTLFLVFYSPNANGPVPWWTLVNFAIGLLFYQTLDAIDGKQARRTGSSSPMGELFDHGCDALSTVFVSLATCVAVQLGQHPIVMFCQVMAASIMFYTAHWQTYVSGTLHFGKFDVTEAQFTIIIIHLLTAILGPSIWSTRIPYLDVEMKMVCVMATLGGSAVNIMSYMSTIFSGGSGKNGSTIAGTSILSPLMPIASVVVSSVIIYIKSPTRLYESNTCLYLLTFGLVITKVTNKLIVAHMTKYEIKTMDSILIGPSFLIFNQYFNTFISEYVVLWLALIWTVIDVVWYATKVCDQISNHLHINVFSIQPRAMDSGPRATQTKPGPRRPVTSGPMNEESSALLSPTPSSLDLDFSDLDQFVQEGDTRLELDNRSIRYNVPVDEGTILLDIDLTQEEEGDGDIDLMTSHQGGGDDQLIRIEGSPPSPTI